MLRLESLSRMDRVEGLMKSLKLSEMESKGRKIVWGEGNKVGMVEPQVIAKLMSDKPAYAEGLANALARVWCPLKGLDCKDMGENTFLFTFHQPVGKRKALADGPWEFGKCLLVVEDFVPSKTLKEYEFRWVPVWVRIFNLPLGMMYREAGEAIGGFMRETLEVDVGPDGMAAGSFLRVKVRIDIQQPLMRGFTREEGKEEKKRRIAEPGGGREVDLWCRFEYEFLPDFCYTCGRLGHVNNECSS